MKKIIILLSCVISLSLIVQAQQTSNAPAVPEIIKQNCNLTSQGTIDYCPAFWQALASRNRTLSSEWNSLLSSGVTTLKTYLDTEIANQTKEKLKLIRTTPSPADLFMREYDQYIYKLLSLYLTQHSNDTSQIITDFFKTTYFDADQSGLGISRVKLYKNIPTQYDDTVVIAFDIRNYTTDTIDNIEGIYCFNTINGQDYIYPLNIDNAFTKNSVTTIVAPLSTKNSPWLDTYGTKNLYCTLVYTTYDQERYTNRGLLEFIMKE